MCDLATAERGGDETEHALRGEAETEVDVFGNLKGKGVWSLQDSGEPRCLKQQAFSVTKPLSQTQYFHI